MDFGNLLELSHQIHEFDLFSEADTLVDEPSEIICHLYKLSEDWC